MASFIQNILELTNFAMVSMSYLFYHNHNNRVGLVYLFEIVEMKVSVLLLWL